MAEEKEEDFSKLSLEDKLSHKVWKARLLGYEEATKLFKRIDDENSPEYTPFVGLVRKFPVESNAFAQEKALEATLAFVECSSASAKICSEVISGIVAKCLNGRPKTKQFGIDICMMYIEIEKQDVVLEEVLKGISNKQPKIVAGSIAALRQGLQDFGAAVINMKVLLKSIPKMFEHSDKTVRAEAKMLAIEVHRWVGPALKAAIDGKLKPIQIKELEDEFSKLPGDPPVATRLLRSQQAVVIQATPTASESDEGGAVAISVPTPAAIDPYDLMEAVNVLTQMPKDFYEKIVDTKWKERKEALEALLPLAQSPKIEDGDFGELIKILKKIITKDSNVLVVALAGNVITGLAKGLRKKFGSYASSCLSAIFEKFKEKKLNVVTSLREASDAIYLTTNLTNIQEECSGAFENKNPSVKSEVLLFLSRCYCQCVPALLPKPYLKAMCPLIVQRLDDTAPAVRDAACEALGTLLKVLGDRMMTAYIESVDKTKMTKINEFKEKVELKAPPPGSVPAPVSKPPETKSQATPADKKDEEGTKSEAPVKKKPAQKKVVKKKTETSSDPPSEEPSAKKPPAKEKKTAAASGGGGGATASSSSSKSKGKGGGAVGKWEEPPDVPEPNISNEEVDDKANEILPSGLLDQLANTNWKERLAGHESFKEFVEGQPPDQMQSVLYCKVLARKPGWKDSNFQVMKAKFVIVCLLAEKATTFGKKSAAVVFPALVDKFADIKVKGQCSDTLMMIAERLTLNYTSLQVMKLAFEHKSPKVQSESVDWLSESLKQFGFLLNVKPHVDYIKKALAASNPAVRTSAINLLGTMCMYMGAQLRMFFEGEKAALLQQIDDAFAKVSGESPPAPTRGPNVKSASEGEGDDGGGDSGGGAPALSLADLMPKVDISGQIKAELIKELGDKNWKVRGEGLQKVQEIVSAAKFIQPSLGELPAALKARLGDSNKNLVMTTLAIIGSLGTAMGSACSKFNKVFVPAVIQTLGDSKPQVRAAGITSLSTWTAEVGLLTLLEQDLLAPSLANDNPNLRIELFGWLEEKFPEISGKKLPNEALNLIPPLYVCLEDRSADVRKKAQGVLPLLMVAVGYETMLKHTGKLKPASKQLVKGLLDKHRPSLPAEPPKPKKDVSSTPPKDESSGSSSKKTQSTPGGKSKQSAAAGKSKGGKSAQDEDDSPELMLVPNAKEQRMKDEEKLKILKWNFQMPRPEHIDQLKDQMLSCVSLSLHKKLFHDDFKQQLNAVSTLNQLITANVNATIGCFDLLLRWVTLKFFDTNTTVNIKCLEFLQNLFRVLTSSSYRMSDYEAGSFLPYLVNKVGDPKDPIRKAVRALFRDICNMYPPGKLFTYVIDGLKSKNARQRTECLEVLGEMIQNNGMIVCQPSPPKTIPLIAAQITDRDNGVRSAALNTMVIVYGNIGDGIQKYTQQLSEKEVSLLEERIKRSGKIIEATAAALNSRSKTPSPSPVTPEPQIDQNVKEVHKPPSPVNVPAPVTVSPPRSSSIPKLSGPFSLDMGRYHAAPRSSLIRPRVSRPDVSSLEQDVTLPEFATSKLIRNPPKSLSISPSRQSITSSAISYIISQITSSDPQTSSKALAQIEQIVTDQRSLLLSHIDQLLRAILMQKRITFTTHLSLASTPEHYTKILNTSRTLAGILVQVFNDESLATKVHQETLVELERDIFGYLIDEKLLCLDGIAQLNRVYNVLMGHIVEKTNKNVIFGSLFQVMLESLTTEGGTTKLSDMAMKCLWRLTRQLQDMVSSLNVDQLLRDIDSFFIGHSSLNPNPSANDKPYRTVKTVLYHLANILGTEVLDHLSLIKDPSSSSVVQYLHKTVKKRTGSAVLKQDMVKQNEPANDALLAKKEPQQMPVSNALVRCELSAESSSRLTTILETIKDPKTTRQGMEDLYDFTETHPEIDFAAILSSTSEFFRSYITRGLKNVASWREAGGANFGQEIESEDYERLRRGLENVRERASKVMNINLGHLPAKPHPLDNMSTDENKDPLLKSGTVVTDGTATITKRKGPISTSSSTTTSTSTATGTSFKLDDLRKRLDKIKGTSS